MDLTLTKDQELIQETAREVLTARRGSADAAAVAGDPAGYSAELWRELVDLGWTGLAFPEAHGGVGLGFLELCLVIEEMGRARTPSPFLSAVACCGMPIARFGTDAQQERWLGALVAGRVMSPVRAAPGGRWGAAGSDVTASPDGAGGLRLDGTALFVPHPRTAEDFLVIAQTGEPGELTAVLADAETPGLSREPLRTVGAERLGRVRFDSVTVPGDRVLGEPGAGRAVADAIDAYGAAATCAEMVGGAQGVLDLTVEYAGQRHQFGRPIGSFQAVQHHCADMAVDVLGARLIAYEAIWRLSAGQDAAMAVSSAKAWVSEAYQRVCDLGHQVHGAIGFTAEHDLHWWLRHAVASALAFGDSDFHTERLARQLGL